MRRKLTTTAGYLSWPASAAPCVVPIDAPPPSCWRLSFLARTTPSTRSWAPAVPVGLSRSTSAASGRPPQPGLLGPGEADGTRAGVRRPAAAPAPPKTVGLERARSDRGPARPAPWWRSCGQRRTSHPRSLRPPAGERPGARPCRHDAPTGAPVPQSHSPGDGGARSRGHERARRGRRAPGRGGATAGISGLVALVVPPGLGRPGRESATRWRTSTGSGPRRSRSAVQPAWPAMGPPRSGRSRSTRVSLSRSRGS